MKGILKQHMIGYDKFAMWPPYRRGGMKVLQHGTNVIDHAVSKIYEDENCEAVLLMNVSSAFNNLDRALLPNYIAKNNWNIFILLTSVQ